ncbi:hypothetical protein K504DRAFT_368934 [Pleomassaria siparia CBS 279.74]|uniref:Zn(2)-C6 fungal-type domain-containing protein n=1 Tax=Pleomassaria siparia CBS 279.74 TaxID=1314801 RepID=A0A6G1KKU8_9PLEO|nr:hypothetical protein K504DRAFT_368934 [Pleomassaria siparia CBS 279.74]
MRNPVACVSCRSAKQRCIHNDAPPCHRCKQGGRAEACEFPPPGTSSIHRRPKRPRQDLGSTPPSHASEAIVPGGSRSASASTSVNANANQNQGPEPAYRRIDAASGSGISPTHAAHHPSPNYLSSASLLEGLDPFELLTDEVKNSYLRCSYKWSFHHTPTLLLRIRDRTLEIWMAWAILALAIRFVKEPPAGFSTQTEASNAFAAHARQILQSDLETPSISRVQALLMLTGHDWGAGNGRRAWIYLGMAIRLVEVMELCQEPKTPKNRAPTREEFIEAEVRRRTAWTCFLMDSLLSGGKGRKRSLTAADMTIQLPCEREGFVFGEAVCTESLDGKLRMPLLSRPVGELGIIAYSMRAANIWGKVARWACSDVVGVELPWSPTSEFNELIHELESWKQKLPRRLQYGLFSLHSHNAVDQGQAYCYMHCIYFMSYMFLHRAYLPVLGPHAGTDEGPSSYNEHTDMWKNWQKTSRRELFKESGAVLEMLDEMRTFGVFFLRGLVPWIGFTIYTAVGVMLYSFNFPSGEDDPRITDKARERVIQGCMFLKEMKNQWPMADTWFETIKRMQAYYRSALGQEGPVSPDERQALRRAMIDYGALQPSPVQRPLDASNDNGKPDTTIVRDSVAREVSIASPSHNLMSPPTATPNGYASNFSWNPNSTQHSTQHTTTPPPIEIDVTSFDLDFDFGSVDMEALGFATQDFWGSFPGEVGSGFQYRPRLLCLTLHVFVPRNTHRDTHPTHKQATSRPPVHLCIYIYIYTILYQILADFQAVLLGIAYWITRLFTNNNICIPHLYFCNCVVVVVVVCLSVCLSRPTMGVYYEEIPNSLKPWILDQKMLWVGSAPLSGNGHINISPKGGPDFFGIVSPTQFWFMDLTGSGIETTSHLHEPGNARICVMFIAFEGAPKIIRIWGKGRVLENDGGKEFNGFVESEKVKCIPGTRSIIVVDIEQVGSSCGFSVPFFEFKAHRDTLNDFFKKKQDEDMVKYWAFKSQLSVDGLPGMKRGYDYARQNKIVPLKKFIGKAAPKGVMRSTTQISAVQLLLVGLLSLAIGVLATLTLVSPEIVRRVQSKEAWA